MYAWQAGRNSASIRERAALPDEQENIMNVRNANGKTFDFNDAITMMDDEIREKIANDGVQKTEQEFLSAYERAHFDKYGTEWELSKANPIW